MRKVVSVIAVVGLMAGLILGELIPHLFGTPNSRAASTGIYGAVRSLGLSPPAFSKLKVLEQTLFHVEESYVDPSRLDWEEMYSAALEAIEWRVPACLFTRSADSGRVTMEVGSHRRVLDVPPVGSRRALQLELMRIAVVLEEHLSKDDVPVNDPLEDPFPTLEYALVNGVLSTLDPHSILLPPRDSEEMEVENQGQFGGLGITIGLRKGQLTIEYPLKDTPAERAGLVADDRIMRIDGESTINMSLDEAVSRMRGMPGDPVVLEIHRDGFNEPFDVEIIREMIKIHPVEAELMDGGIGYLSIKSFHQSVRSDLHAGLTRLHREAGGQIRGLILDLRGNAGGYLHQAVAVADTFLDRGVIVSTVDSVGREREVDEARAAGTEPDYPIVVLVDAHSASASEIVAGALKDHGRVVVVGERTFGKGSVQHLHGFHDGSRLKLTIAKYLTGGDGNIQGIGVPEDITLKPVLIGEKPEDGEVGGQRISLFWRERVTREVDLDTSFTPEPHGEKPAYYTVQFVREPIERQKSDNLNLASDYDVQFAWDVLVASPSQYRAEILGAAELVVKKHQNDGAQDLETQLLEVGIDWKKGPQASEETDWKELVGVSLDLGEDGYMTAGATEAVTLEVHNRSDESLFQVAVVGKDHELFEGREFLFGHLGPGERREYSHRIKVPDGYRGEAMPIHFELRGVGGQAFLTAEVPLKVISVPLPLLAWKWRIHDEDNGDGDGVAELGERISLELTVENHGEGPTREAFARIKNQSGRALDIIEGSIDIGFMRDGDGEPCEVIKPGVEAGRVVGHPGEDMTRIENRELPEYASECVRTLDQGESWTGAFSVDLKESLNKPFRLELSLGDALAFDYGAVIKAGFYSYFSQREFVEFELDGALVEIDDLRSVPTIKVTKPPLAIQENGASVISGLVQDTAGVSYILVFVGDDKVFYLGSDEDTPLYSIPFTVDLELEEGENIITVLSANIHGFTNTHSQTVFVP